MPENICFQSYLVCFCYNGKKTELIKRGLKNEELIKGVLMKEVLTKGGI